jgi:hypothetical protein
MCHLSYSYAVEKLQYWVIWHLIVIQAIMEFLLWNPEFHHCHHKSQTNGPHPQPCQFRSHLCIGFVMNFNIIFSFVHEFPQVKSSQRVSTGNKSNCHLSLKGYRCRPMTNCKAHFHCLDAT